jgi:hypothetical protein
MGYGYAETFLIVFLTHPNVIIPPAAAVDSLMPAPGLLPAGGLPPILSSFLQMFWVWVLSLPGERSPGVGWTMFVLYIIFLCVYIYYGMGMRIAKGV